MSLKDRIKSIVRSILGMRLYEKLVFRYHLGYWPDLQKPGTFCEKIVHRKLFSKDERMVMCSDKVAVREYITEKVGYDILPEEYAIVSSVSEVPDDLPAEFFLKASFGSGINHHIVDYTPNRKEEINTLVEEMLRSAHIYGILSSQWWYEKIPKKILVEEVLRDSEGDLPCDYKFYCFHGKTEFIHVDYDRFGEHTRSYYSREWELLPFTSRYPQGPQSEPPGNLEEMIETAERIADGFDFVRVDLYSIDDQRIVFGEMTFAPDAGWVIFSPTQEPDWQIGKLWNL